MEEYRKNKNKKIRFFFMKETIKRNIEVKVSNFYSYLTDFNEFN